MPKKYWYSLLVAIIAGIFIYQWGQAQEVYADIGYRLSASPTFFPGPQSYLNVSIEINNKGNLDAQPTLIVTVKNATITKVYIPKVADSEAKNYYKNNGTQAEITYFKAPKNTETFMVFGGICVVPNDGTQSFGVFLCVNIPSNVLHPKSCTTPYVPFKLIYIKTAEGFYRTETS